MRRLALHEGSRVWPTPDILPLDAWLAREIVRRYAATDAALPRLLAPAEDWLIWREATAALTADLDLVARAPLAESLRRAEQLAFEFAIDILGMHGGGSEQSLLRDAARLVRARHQAWNAATTCTARCKAACSWAMSVRVLIAGFPGPLPSLTR